jgi:uncharacterized protein
VEIAQLLPLVYGLLVGVSLGLTGGGGSIFAVPLLIYALAVPVRTAVALSLAAVGATAGFGAALRWKAGEVEVLPGIIFAVGGMVFAPFGTWIGHMIPSAVLLSAFAILMAYVGWRMWRGKSDDDSAPGPCSTRAGGKLGAGCYARLIAAGAAAGTLSGLFGVGGGFIIVPALLYVTGTTIHRAVATSLMVIFLISISAVATTFWKHAMPLPLTVLFVGGGVVGMLIGSKLRTRLNGPKLRQVFAIAMWLVAAYLLVKNIAWTSASAA